MSLGIIRIPIYILRIYIIAIHSCRVYIIYGTGYCESWILFLPSFTMNSGFTVYEHVEHLATVLPSSWMGSFLVGRFLAGCLLAGSFLAGCLLAFLTGCFLASCFLVSCFLAFLAGCFLVGCFLTFRAGCFLTRVLDCCFAFSIILACSGCLIVLNAT